MGHNILFVLPTMECITLPPVNLDAPKRVSERENCFPSPLKLFVCCCPTLGHSCCSCFPNIAEKSNAEQGFLRVKCVLDFGIATLGVVGQPVSHAHSYCSWEGQEVARGRENQVQITLFRPPMNFCCFGVAFMVSKAFEYQASMLYDPHDWKPFDSHLFSGPSTVPYDLKARTELELMLYVCECEFKARRSVCDVCRLWPAVARVQTCPKSNQQFKMFKRRPACQTATHEQLTSIDNIPLRQNPTLNKKYRIRDQLLSTMALLTDEECQAEWCE